MHVSKWGERSDRAREKRPGAQSSAVLARAETRGRRLA
jgi:hypothetical protein